MIYTTNAKDVEQLLVPWLRGWPREYVGAELGAWSEAVPGLPLPVSARQTFPVVQPFRPAPSAQFAFLTR